MEISERKIILSGPSPWPLSHHAGEPVSEETALSPCPQARAEVITACKHLDIPGGPERGAGPSQVWGLKTRVPPPQGSLIPGLGGWMEGGYLQGEGLRIESWERQRAAPP